MAASQQMIDFTNVKESSGINKKRIPAGDYAAVITKVEDAPAKDKTPQYLFHIKIKEHSSTVLPYYCKLQENQLWKLRNIFIAAGKTVPKKKIKVDPNQIVGKLIGVTVADTEYENKEQSEIDGVFPAADLEDGVDVGGAGDEGDDEDLSDDSVDDEPETSGPSFTPDADEDEADEADEPEADEEPEAPADPYEGLSRNEIKAKIKEHQTDFVAKKSQTDDDLKAILAKLDAASGNDEEDLTDIDIDDL